MLSSVCTVGVTVVDVLKTVDVLNLISKTVW